MSQQQSKCRACGSERIIPNVRILDTGGEHYEFTAQVFGNPGAMVFKDRTSCPLSLTVCGDCGLAEMRVKDPEALYDAYQRSLKS